MFVKNLIAELRTPDLPPILIGFSVIIAISGPFGSYAELGFWERFAFWAPFFSIGAISFLAFRVLVLGFTPKALRGPAAICSAVLYAVLTAPIFGELFAVVFGPNFGTLEGWGEIGTLVFLVSLGLCFLRHSSNIGHLESDLGAAAEPPELTPPVMPAEAVILVQSPASARPKLFDRLAADMRGELCSLEVDDHYVIVTTDKGRISLLMRLSDAISETLPDQGAQLHRSFWVAWSSIKRVERADGRWFVEMACGNRIPVSRANVTKLAARGLI